MSLGAGALARPLRIQDAHQLHGPWIAMGAVLLAALLLAAPRRRLDRRGGWALLLAYPVVVVAVLAR
jgi:Ca2+/Na+ antiporter